MAAVIGQLICSLKITDILVIHHVRQGHTQPASLGKETDCDLDLRGTVSKTPTLHTSVSEETK